MKKGSKMSAESREKMSIAHKGIPKSNETRRRLSIALTGHVLTEETKRKISRSRKGQLLSPETREKMSATRRAQREHHNWWRGGITPINQKIRTSFEYKAWRRAVFERDRYTCVSCGQRGGALQADHIKPFSSYPELRMVLSNGRTLCVSCHTKTNTYALHLRRIETSV
jgi:5-methylcytosine-specific restriction endonuclease McrA